jgi:hypothetical protein
VSSGILHGADRERFFRTLVVVAVHGELGVENLAAIAFDGLAHRGKHEPGVGGVEFLAQCLDEVYKVLFGADRVTGIAGISFPLPEEEPGDLIVLAPG